MFGKKKDNDKEAAEKVEAAAGGTEPKSELPLKPAKADQPSPVFRPEISRRIHSDIPGVGTPRGGVTAMPSAPGRGGREAKPSPDPKTLIVGREISLNGEITACDKLVVEGRVEASLSDSRFVDIAESGVFKGAAEIQEADVRGHFDGKLVVKGRLLIRETGRVTGEIRYGQLEIECGGQIAGTIQGLTGVEGATKVAAAD